MALLGEPPLQPERDDRSLRYVPTPLPAPATRQGRREEETRPCQLRVGAVPNAAGSAYLEQGGTKLLAAVYGPRQAENRTRAEGQLSVDLQFAPFAGDFSKEEAEKRMVLYNSILQSTFETVILLERYGKTAFDLTLLVLEDDGAVLTGSLAAASLALADAKVEMRDLVAGATVHLAGPGAAPRLLLDCDRREERALAADAAVLHVGLCPSRGALCLLHAVGNLPPKHFEQMVLLGKDTCAAIGTEMRRCLQEQVQHRAEKKRARSVEPDVGFIEDAMEDIIDAMRALYGLGRAVRHLRSPGLLVPAHVPLRGQWRGMKLTPRELDHLRLSQAGQLAQRRLARGLRLNHPEAIALLTSQMMEFIRDGESVATLMDLGKQLLGRRQVLPGVERLIPDVQARSCGKGHWRH
ncbi:unnamed protein product [Effrenium voratum]|nr:unnamed protein product [Effrenium voratum]